MKVRTKKTLLGVSWLAYFVAMFGLYLPLVLAQWDSPLVVPMAVVLCFLWVVLGLTTAAVKAQWEAGLVRCMECDEPLLAVRELETPTHSFGRCPTCKRGYKLEKRR